MHSLCVLHLSCGTGGARGLKRGPVYIINRDGERCRDDRIVHA
jgi:hypothetical protein